MVSGGGAGAEGMEEDLATDRNPGTRYRDKRSKIAFAFTFIVLSLEQGTLSRAEWTNFFPASLNFEVS